jgi:carbon storage regulator
MLILSRKHGESIVIDGGITVTVLKVKGKVVQLGIVAPKEVPILRGELRKRMTGLELPEVTGVFAIDGRRQPSAANDVQVPD